MNALEKKSLNDILSRLITGIIEVIERQMYDYIEGNLSNIPSPMASQTLSAPALNMFAEKTLGLAEMHIMSRLDLLMQRLSLKYIKHYHGFVQNLKTSRTVKLLNFV